MALHSVLQRQRVSAPEDHLQSRRSDRRDAHQRVCNDEIFKTLRSQLCFLSFRTMAKPARNGHRSFLPRPLEHALGPGRRVSLNAVTENDSLASIPATATARNATPLPPSQGIRRDRPTRLRDTRGTFHLSPFTFHQSPPGPCDRQTPPIACGHALDFVVRRGRFSSGTTLC